MPIHCSNWPALWWTGRKRVNELSAILPGISAPEDLRQLTPDELTALAAEIRTEIVDTVRQTGGHLGASLGAVEIILAVHLVFDSPTDKVIFDVGHQAYAHKLLTGRREQFPSLRRWGGISGFPRLGESVHDQFGTGHAGTSISAALGYCLARDVRGEKYKVVTVTGDGALTSGMAFEALNHAGELKTDLIVVLNDNEMSIAPNVGGLSEYLTRLRTDPTYHRVRDDIGKMLSRIPAVGGQMLRVSERLREAVRAVIVPGPLFEELGFSYYGPIDGHNIPLLQRVLREAVLRGGPVLIHAHTHKGRGYGPAEIDPARLHALSPANKGSNGVPSFSAVLGDTLSALAAKDDRIVAITAAMPEGTGLDRFGAQFPTRLFDVGIAEEHAATLAAGLACGGLRPFVAVYSSFMQRAYDQILHDVCLQNLPVTFCLDRAGLVGEDGPTHHGVFDLSFLRSIPNITIMAPRDGLMLQRMLRTALQCAGPVAIRYPRGEAGRMGEGVAAEAVEAGRGEILRSGSDLALLAVGNMVPLALEAAELLAAAGVSAAVADARFVKPLDIDLVLQLTRATRCLLTLEDNVVAGGFGSAVLECLAQRGISFPLRTLGIPDRFIEHGAVEELRRSLGLTAAQVAADAAAFLAAAGGAGMLVLGNAGNV